MATKQPINSVLQHVTTLRELAQILVRHYDLHEGRFQLAIAFRIGIGQVPGPDGASPLPGAIVGVENLSLLPVPPEAEGPDIVDASSVNPASPARALPSKATAKVVATPVKRTRKKVVAK